VVGLVEPAREILRLRAELDNLEKQPCPTSP
jgi:hypothetical protein